MTHQCPVTWLPSGIHPTWAAGSQAIGNPRTEDRFPAPKRKVRKMGKETQRWHPILLEKPLISAIKKCTVLIPKLTHLEGYPRLWAMFCCVLLADRPCCGHKPLWVPVSQAAAQKIRTSDLLSFASAGLLFEETSMGPAVSKSPSTRWIFSFQYLK